MAFITWWNTYNDKRSENVDLIVKSVESNNNYHIFSDQDHSLFYLSKDIKLGFI